MQVTYQLTSEDLYQGCLAWRDQRIWRKWLRWLAYSVVAAESLICLLVLLFDRGRGITRILLFGVTFGVVWFAWMLLAPRFFSKRQFRNHPIAQSAITLNASDAGLEIQSAHSNPKVAWSAYVAWGECKSVFVIMPQPRIYITIPKRAFSEEQIGQFREMLRSNIRTK